MQNSEVEILIPELGGKIGKLVLEDLTSHGISCKVFDDSSFTRDIPKYIKELLREVSEVKPKMILPIFKSEAISKYRDQFPKDIAIPVSESDIIHNLDDKVYTSGLCTELGIRQPKIYSNIELDSIDTFPVVFKRSEGLGGSGVYFPKNRTALDKLIKTSKSHLIEEFIDGYDISVDALKWGEYFHAECYKVILPKEKGFSILRKSIVNEEAVEIAKRILNSTGYQGICGIDFRVSADGNLYFLECNPRFSGGLKSSIKSGFDIPYILHRLINGQSIEKVKFKKGIYSFEKKELKDYIKKRISKAICLRDSNKVII